MEAGTEGFVFVAGQHFVIVERTHLACKEGKELLEYLLLFSE